MKHSRWLKAASVCVSLLVALLLTGCEAGDKDDPENSFLIEEGGSPKRLTLTRDYVESDDPWLYLDAGMNEDAGEVVALVARVANIANLGAYRLELTFDAELVSVVSVKDAEYLGSTAREVKCKAPEMGEGRVVLTCVTIRLEPDGPSGDGVIAHVQVRPIDPGTSTIRLEGSQLNTPDAQKITTALGGIHVTLGE